MLNFSGQLSPRDYWQKLALLILELIVVTPLLYLALDRLDGEVAGASLFSQILAAVTYLLLVANGFFVMIAGLSIIVRRGRDIGNAILWVAIAAFVPLGFVILGLAPGQKRTK
jgi:uncharacterized membrane protein YhaH (DUF805 family)